MAASVSFVYHRDDITFRFHVNNKKVERWTLSSGQPQIETCTTTKILFTNGGFLLAARIFWGRFGVSFPACAFFFFFFKVERAETTVASVP